VTIFSERQHMLTALYASARLSVRLSHGRISKKRLKLRLWNFHNSVVPLRGIIQKF